MWQGQQAASDGVEGSPGHVGALANSLAVLACGAALANDGIKCVLDDCTSKGVHVVIL